jgi:NADPH:quinone reductase-like Zn-dependent oxidoreductase
MRAIVWSDYGPPSRVLSLGEVARPVPRDGEVLVRVAAASVHAGDWLELTGAPYAVRLASGLPRPRRTSPGRDVAGRVEAVGAGVQRLAPGDEVFGECIGALAEFACGREGRLASKPAALSFEQAAAVPVSGVTALRALRDVAEVRPGAKVLVNGASGGVGTFAVQIAKALGAQVTGVCSTPNLELIRSIGADLAIDYTREDFTRGGERYDVILDNAGTRSLSECRRVLTPGGTLIPNNGTTGGRWFGTIGRSLGALMMSPFVGQRLRPFFSTTTREHLESLTELIDAGSVMPVIAATYDLSRSADALDHVGTGHAAGKVVITL